ncbi:MAG TPA: hypothetical protein VFB32_06510 [Rudaea sp.]|nr:hypothetical protein [Rudaea sp.]
MSLRAQHAALVFALFSGGVFAADLVGYSESFDTLVSVNLTTRKATELGAAGYFGQQRVANVEGLSMSPDGNLYAVSDALKVLVRINPANGAASLVGPLNLAGESNPSAQLDFGMTFTCDGSLWLSAGDGNFWQVDPSTGATTLIGNMGVKVTGLASSGETIYAAGSQGNNQLYTVDPGSAHVTAIGAYGTTNYITTTSPAFDATGKLWAILGYIPPNTTNFPQQSDLANLDTAKGTLTNHGGISVPQDLETNYFGNLRGFAISPPACVLRRPTDATPAVSGRGLALLIGLVMLVAGTRLRRRHPMH